MIARFRAPLLVQLFGALKLLAILLFVALAFSPKATTRFYQWPWHFYWELLLIAPVVALGVRLLAGRPVARFGGWIDAGLIAGLAVAVVSAARSEFPQQSLKAILVPLAGVCTAWLALTWIEADDALRERRHRTLARGVGAFAAVFVVVSASTWLAADALPALARGAHMLAIFGIRNEYPFGHSTYVAGFAVLVAPWLLASGLTVRGHSRILWLALGVLALALVPTTASRGGVAGVMVLIAGAAGWWLQSASVSRHTKLLAVIGTVALAAVFVGVDPRLRHFVREGKWSAIASESNQQRAAMTEAGWLMGRDHWLLGSGPGTTSLLYPRYRAQLDGGVENVLQLHNTPVQFWADFGLAGILAGVVVLIGAARLAIKGWRQPSDPGDVGRIRRRSLAIALAGYAVFALTDYQLDVPSFAFLVMIYLVLLRADVAPRPALGSFGRPAMTWRRISGGILLGALAAVLWAVVPDLRARSLFNAAASARETGDDTAFVAGAKQAAAAAPWEPFYHVQLAAYYGETAVRVPDARARTEAAAQMADDLQRALARNPDQEYCHFNLGWLLLGHDPIVAEHHFREAARLVPDKGGVYLGIGFCHLARSDRANAVRAFALEWLNNPRHFASPLWESAGLDALHPEIVAAMQAWCHSWMQDAGLSAGRQRQLEYVAALARWWSGETGAAEVLSEKGSREQQAFFAHLPALDRHEYNPAADPQSDWEHLYLAWKTGACPNSIAGTPLATAITRRFAEQPGSFARVLTAPVGQNSGLVTTLRNERPGYSVLAGNQDGFLLRDLYVYPENLLVSRFAASLFPRKGYLPGPVLHGALLSLPSLR